jgi:hypothetical protein
LFAALEHGAFGRIVNRLLVGILDKTVFVVVVSLAEVLVSLRDLGLSLFIGHQFTSGCLIKGGDFSNRSLKVTFSLANVATGTLIGVDVGGGIGDQIVDDQWCLQG